VVVRSTPDDDNITIAVTVGGVARYLNRYVHSHKCLRLAAAQMALQRRQDNTQWLTADVPAQAQSGSSGQAVAAHPHECSETR